MSSAAGMAPLTETEQKFLNVCMGECNKLIASMRMAKPLDAERTRTKLDEIFKRVPKMPIEFKRKITDDARGLECAANMRAADDKLNAAMDKARKDDEPERNRLVSEARGFYNKAVSLGADPRFRATAQRKIDVIMMTGRVENKGASFAKSGR